CLDGRGEPAVKSPYHECLICSFSARFCLPRRCGLCLSGSKVAIKSFVFSTGLVAEKQQFCATRLSDFHELSRAAGPWRQLWQFWSRLAGAILAILGDRVPSPQSAGVRDRKKNKKIRLSQNLYTLFARLR